MTINSIVSLRSAIIEGAKILTGSDDDLTISLEPSGDTLVLSLGDPNLPGVPLRESLTETLVSLAEDTADRLEAEAEEKREAFKESFQGELRDIQEMTEADDVSEWEGILEDIIRSATALKRRMDTSELDEAEKLDEAAEELRSQIQEFEASQKPVALVS